MKKLLSYFQNPNYKHYRLKYLFEDSLILYCSKSP
nr:MAG TPA: hypothetical protein [Caudoviricetes sp.]